MPLTDDEFTVLMIAAEGQSMMPIGRWQVSVESLSARGLLAGPDKFNQLITPAGREALKERDKEDDQAYVGLLEAGARMANGHQQYRQFIEQTSEFLANAVRAARMVTGHAMDHVLDESLEVVRKRTKELLKPDEEAAKQRYIGKFG